MKNNNLKAILKKKRSLIEKALKKHILKKRGYPPVMRDAIKHALFPAGKRIRPVLTLLTADIFGKKMKDVLPAACAIELMHNYSLVHDDMPSMDNDTYRRGRLSVHSRFGEGAALLAGDALLTEAFFLITFGKRPAEVARVISKACGINGMVGGQAADTLVNYRGYSSKKKKELLKYIHLNKTAALIEASVVCGAIASDADKKSLNSLRRYGRNIGLAFQIVDDIFDMDKNKLTYPVIYGKEYSLKYATKLVEDAKEELKIFGNNAKNLSLLADYIIERKN